MGNPSPSEQFYSELCDLLGRRPDARQVLTVIGRYQFLGPVENRAVRERIVEDAREMMRGGSFDVEAAEGALRALLGLPSGSPSGISLGFDEILKPNEMSRAGFVGVEAYRERAVRRTYGGGSLGFSIRIAKGFSIRPGLNAGQSQSEWQLTHLGTGKLGVTSSRLIFVSEPTSFSLAFKKILAVTKHIDGFAVTLDSTAANAKPYVFKCVTDQGQMYEAVKTAMGR